MDDSHEIEVEGSAKRSRLATAAWIVASIFIIVIVVASWRSMETSRLDAKLSNDVMNQKRPSAPIFPTKLFGSSATKVSLPKQGEAGANDGDIVVVNVWASWCAPCVEEAPLLGEISKRYEDKVKFLGINAGHQDIRSRAEGFIDKYEWSFANVRGSRQEVEAWGVRTYPATYVVGRDGKISSMVNGATDEEQLVAMIEHELKRGA